MSISNEDRPDTVDTGDEIFDPPDPIVLSNSLECPTKIEPGSQEPTPFKTIADTDPSDLLDTVTDSALFEPETKILDLPDENALAPSRLRFLLVCGLFLFIAAWSVLNVYDLFSPTSSMPELQIAWQNGRGVVIDVGPAFAGKLSEGDEIVSVNGDRIDERYKYRRAFRYLEAGHNYSLRVLRNGGTIDVDLPVVPLPVEYRLNTILLGIVSPAVFFLTGLLVFLFHPNSKLTVLIAIAFALASASTPFFDLMYPIDRLPLFLLWWSGYLISLLNSPVLLHFFLLFPRPSRLVRRFPFLPFLIYLPFFLYVIPVEVGQKLAFDGFRSFAPFLDLKVFGYTDLIYPPYLIAGFVAFIVNYRDSEPAARRRMRVLLAGLPFAIVPFIVIELLLPPIESLAHIRFFPSEGWRFLVENLPIILAPPIFAYAVVRHRIIPVSFIIRRGLQYIFAKNGLRLMILLPVAGLIWNILADPNRTLEGLVLHNSTGFYVMFAVAVAAGLISRFRLNEWIDRRFFREQYDQERILSRLIENIKESDSMSKLSRLVSSQIEAAMHPSSIYFFYEDPKEGAISLGYTTSEISVNRKLASNSPLLRFMERQTGAVDVPSALSDELGDAETTWLKQIGASLLVPMRAGNDRLSGFFAVGEKRSEIRYDRRDKNILEALANQIGIVHENITLKDRMRSDQRIRNEVFARFDESDLDLLKECESCGRCYGRADDICEYDGRKLSFSLPVGRTIHERYRLEKLLGKGGMGAVYSATDLRMDRQVALKILSGALFGNREAQHRFEREARSAGKLNHRNIVTIFDYGALSTEGSFLTMELVQGETLADVLHREKRLQAATVVGWTEQVLDGIEAAHACGIIHRDLKPDNIYVTTESDGSVRMRILDFGLARFKQNELSTSVTVPGTVIGTLGYMSPEQLHGERTDERSDLFSLAVIIYECLYGKRPFTGNNYLELARSMDRPVSIEPQDRFSDLLRQGLALEPRFRFASAAEMRTALIKSFDK